MLDLLAALVDRSLVLAEPPPAGGYPAREARGGAGLRYRMLETVREYAREKLIASGELAEVRSRHRDWYLQFAEQAEAAAYRRGQAEWLTRLAAELDNLRAALAWCQEEADATPAPGAPGNAGRPRGGTSIGALLTPGERCPQVIQLRRQ